MNLKVGQAVAFDFDGVIHKYSEGWLDGSIYDEANEEVIKLIRLLQDMIIPVFILSTRDPYQIKEWWDNQNFNIPSKVITDDCMFYKNNRIIGITNRKLPAQLYVDDRAYNYHGQSIDEFLHDFEERTK